MRPSRERTKPLELPKARPVVYFKQDHSLVEELVDAYARKQAEELVELAPTQLRRFYEHVLSIKRRLDLAANNPVEREREFSKLRPEFKLLKAKAVYAYGRNHHKEYYKALAEFFISHTESVKKAADFEAFCKHFEAVIAFHKFYAEGGK